MLKKSYLRFYLQGRDAKLFKEELDQLELATKVAEGITTPRLVAERSAIEIATPHRTGRDKTRWLREEEDEIRAAGGDGEVAYDHYMQGRVDALATALEVDIVEALAELGGEA